MDINLTDLGIYIKSMTSVNLLDSRHYSFTEEQLKKSAQKGSLFLKRNKVIVRSTTPDMVKKDIEFSRYNTIPSRQRSLLEIKQEHYKELDISEDISEEEEPLKKDKA